MISRRAPHGFTAIELMTVVAITAFLAVIGSLSYQNIKRNVVLSDAAQEFMDTVRMAQNRSISSQEGVDHGIRVEANQYELFRCDDTACGSPIFETPHVLNSGLAITAGIGVIQFQRLIGSANPAREVTLAYGSAHKNVDVSSAGTVTLSE